MSFEGAIRKLNGLKRRKIIRDYALIGAVAATVYMEPMFTEDLDVVVLVDSDEEYLETFRAVGELAEGTEGMHYYFDEVPVQIFPSTIKPLFRDAVVLANTARMGNVRVKVAPPEHGAHLLSQEFGDRVQLVEVQGAGHAILPEQPQAVHTAVLGFANRIFQ